MEAFAEIDSTGKRCEVHFRYSRDAVDAIKRVPGSRFVPRDKGGPFWRLPLDMTSMRRLREEFKKGLQLGDALRAWGWEAVKNERQMHKIAVADDWPLEDLVISKKLPEMAEWFRPYQRADVKFLATTSAMNLLQPRLGKTTEIIGAIYEAGLENGHHLVVAPQKTLDSVWRMEFERWTDMRVFTFSGETPKRQRNTLFSDAWYYVEEAKPFVFVTTADMIRRGLEGDLEQDVEWCSFTIDEFHKTGLPVAKNKFPQRAVKLPMAENNRRWALSGTPMGGKPIKLWGALHFLYPDLFTSRIRWEDQWLEIEDVHVGRARTYRKVRGVRPEREEEFYQHMAPYAVRRLRSEVLPQLPPIIPVDIWCEMTKSQKKQYDTFAAQAEIRIDEYHLSATSILAEYTRLKQFSNAVNEVEVLGEEEDGRIKMKLVPTFDSGKLPYLMERLAEAGIDPEDPDGDAQAIVASQFRETIEMVYNYLDQAGIPCIKITGKSRRAESELAQAAFKRGADNQGLRVVCMVTTIGVGLTLDNVESVHVLDQTWNPDDQEQLIDRAVNTSSLHQVTAFFYRSIGTIEQYIHETNEDKTEVNKTVLDELRRKFKRK